jgi:hypothetical protein
MQFCPTHEQTTPEDNRSFQFQVCAVKVRRKKGKARPWLDQSYLTRSEIIAFMKKAEELDLNLQDIPEFLRELKRTGVLLNQVVKLAHLGRVPVDYSERVMAAVKVVEALRP